MLAVSDGEQNNAVQSDLIRLTAPQPVPLPAGFPLLIAGVFAFAVVRRRGKRA